MEMLEVYDEMMILYEQNKGRTQGTNGLDEDTYVDVGIVDATARIEIADNCIDTTDGKTLTRKSLVR
eukprot:scaffold5567_cov202-Alexandrium_tamarense.AAC.12